MLEGEKMKTDKAVELAVKELERATELHGPFRSAHEGYAVILEELDELWDIIKGVKSFTDRPSELKKEATQVAAMALRFLVNLCEDDSVKTKTCLEEFRDKLRSEGGITKKELYDWEELIKELELLKPGDYLKGGQYG